MMKTKYLTRAEYDSLKNLPMVINFNRSDHVGGLAPYFREYLRVTLTAKEPAREHYASWQMQKFKEDSIEWATNPLYGWVNKRLKGDGSIYDIYRDGLKIYTTIDSRLQSYAEQAVIEHMSTDINPSSPPKKRSCTSSIYTAYLTGTIFRNNKESNSTD